MLHPALCQCAAARGSSVSLTRHLLGGGENRPHSMFSPIKRERIKIETSSFQYLQVEAFATSDNKMEVKVTIGHEI